MISGANQMPMGAKAMQVSGTPANLMPPMPMQGQPPADPMPPTGGLPPPAAQTGSTLPGFPAPASPSEPPWSVRLQSDGSSIYVIPSPDGDPAKDIVLGRNEPPKLPKAFAPSAPKPQGA